MKRNLFLSIGQIVVLVAVLAAGCRHHEPSRLRIALSKGSPDSLYANYYNWIGSLDSTAECLDMYAMPEDSALMLLESCAGLLLTGGTDINPGFYNRAHDTVRCWPVDAHRDALEMRLLDSALAWGMPVLGICRGHQMINVALGGSLIVDIPQDVGMEVAHQCEDYLSCYHPVRLDPDSKLAEITGIREGEVTSNHHQAAYTIAPGLKASASASDGVIEALEWGDPSDKSFLIGVQWHPERMDISNPLSGKIGMRFLEECRRRIY